MALYPRTSRYAARRPARKSYKARTPYARNARSSGVVTVPRTLSTGGGFPEKMITTLRYVETLTLTTGSTVASKIFRLNSCFDPNYSDTGHQPLYYDQLQAIYGRYQVLGAKMTVQFTALTDATGSGATTEGPWLCGISANNDGTFPTDTNTLCEQNKTVYQLLQRDDANSSVEKMITYVPKRDLGLDGMDDAQGAAVTTNPNQTYWAQAWAFNTNYANGAQVKMLVTIDQRVCFIRQSNIAGS